MSPTEPSSAKHQRPSVEKELFLSPPNDCRPAPFWSINDLLDPAEVRRQVREFARVGYGGWFFHARVGIATRYLSADWMDAFAAALDEGKQHGHLCWLYDEDSYPSGFAGGLVLREHPEFRGKAIKMAQGEPPAGCRVMARFAVKGGTSVPLVRSLAGARRLREGEPPAQGEQLLTFYEALYPTGGWFNGGSYIDALNPSAIDAFLRSTHDRYAERFRAEFGQSIPGIFTDEPHIQPMTGPFSVTWTDDFDAEFQRQHGYSLLDRLPALFFTMPDSGRVRTDYWQTLARRFQTACIGRMAEWCERHGLALTGHCWEHGFPQAGHAGSFNFAEIPMQWPGIDLLFGNTDKGRLLGRLQGQVGRMTVVKSISGLAHQFGRPRIMSETYGGAGWEVTFRDLKEILDWECVLGVNYVVPHLSHYSLRGCRKRDYPPSFLDHAPWWPELRLINDYTARLCYALSCGRPRVDIAVLQPLSSAWTACAFRPEEAEPLARVGLLFENLIKTLAENQWEFDLVDELTLADHGKAADGRLHVGQAAYKVLVVPSTPTLFSGAVKVLRQLRDAGVRLVWVAPAPQQVDGSPSAELAELGAGGAWAAPEAASLGQAMQKVILRRFTAPVPDDRSLAKASQKIVMEPLSKRFFVPPAVSRWVGESLQGIAMRTLVAETLSDVEPLPIYVQTRVLDDGVAVFWVNTSNRAARVQFRCAGSLAVEDWDLLTGATSAIPVHVEGDETVWSEDVAPGQSRLLRIRPQLDTAPQSPRQAENFGGLELADEWNFGLLTPNVLVLDLVEYRVGDEAWSERKGVLEALGELRRRFGMANEPELRHNRAARFYDIWQNPRAFQTVQLRYAVHCAAKAADLGDVCFVVESGERFAIRVNGQTATDRDGAWLDPSFTKYRIGHLLRSGDNEIVLSTEFREDTELETAFVIGRFGVWRRGPAEFQLGSLPKTLRAGSWTEQGLPFFGGRVRIWQQVRLPQGLLGWELCASSLPIPVATVYAAGQKAGHLLWPPHRVPLPKALAGDVRLELECVSGMKNTLGPWHWSSAFNEARITAPNSWFNRCGGWADEYHLEPEGIPTGLRLEQTA